MQEVHFHCLYCGLNKPTSESSLEHAIPQFMGGGDAPQQYKIRNVCTQCNSLLGLFVDASFAKSWFVTNGLAIAAGRLYAGLSDPPLPPTCMGLIQLPQLLIPESEVAEHWIGPSGETVIWIRSHDERLSWYSGGNPIDKKKKNSTAYLSMTGQDPSRWEMGIASFLEAFKGKRIRKILCPELIGAPAGAVAQGFDARTSDDEANVLAIRAAIGSGQLRVQASVHKQYDLRFISKMALGVGYSLFGEPYLATSMATEARKGCWPKDGVTPESLGSSTLASSPDARIAKMIGYPGAVAVTVIVTRDMYVMSVTIDQRLPFTVELAPTSLASPYINKEEGYVLLLIPQLRKVIELTFAGMVAHASGVMTHPELQLIDDKQLAASLFHAKLGPV